MEIFALIYAILVSYYAIDTKLELNDLRDQPPRIVKEIQIQRVLVPIASQCPVPKQITKPTLLIESLSIEDYTDYGKVSNAYAISLSQCMGYAEEQSIVLDGYRTKSVKPE